MLKEFPYGVLIFCCVLFCGIFFFSSGIGADQEVITSPCLNRTTGSVISFSCSGCFACACGVSGTYCAVVSSGTGYHSVTIECLPFSYTYKVSQGCYPVKTMSFHIDRLPATVTIDGRSYRIDRLPYTLNYSYSYVYATCLNCGVCTPCPTGG